MIGLVGYRESVVFNKNDYIRSFGKIGDLEPGIPRMLTVLQKLADRNTLLLERCGIQRQATVGHGEGVVQLETLCLNPVWLVDLDRYNAL